MNYRIVHTTRYRYEQPVAASYNEAHLLPRSFTGQTVRGAGLTIDPPCQDYRDRQDFFGNTASYFSIVDAHREVTITAVSDVQLLPARRQLSFGDGVDWQTAAGWFAAPIDPDVLDAAQFCLDSPLVRGADVLRDYAAPSFAPGRPLAEAAAELMARIHGEFAYDPAATDIATPLGEVLQKMGMTTAFDKPEGSADFDAMAPKKPDDYLCISEVFHKTFLELDEKGTEAAAATAGAMPGALAAMPEPPRPVELKADRPFLFAIQHSESGACLFFGRVSDPR